MVEYYGDVPAFSRNYGDSFINGIEADIAAMEDFAKGLRSEVEVNYNEGLTKVTNDMLTEVPPISAWFPELVSLMQYHQEAQDAAHQNAYGFRTDTTRLATAAQTIGKQYGDSDAFSRAKVSDVDKALQSVDSGLTKSTTSVPAQTDGAA